MLKFLGTISGSNHTVGYLNQNVILNYEKVLIWKNFKDVMNSRFMVSMAIAVVGLAVGFILLYDIQQGKEETKTTPKSLNNLLDESNNRLKIVKDDFYNGKYHGDLSIDEVKTVISSEVEVQKGLLEQYKELPDEMKTDKTIDTRFWQLGKYSWAGEESILKALEENP